MKKFLVGSSVATTLLGFAQIVAAQVPVPTGGALTNVTTVIARIQNLINAVIPLLVGIAVLVIVYGVISFITKAADEEARANAKQFIIWGIIGVFIMLSVWGLVTILYNSFGTDAATAKNAAVQSTVPVVTPGTF